MLKKLITAGFLVSSLAVSGTALATDPPIPNEIIIYCIRDFYTGQLLCIEVPAPDPGPVWT